VLLLVQSILELDGLLRVAVIVFHLGICSMLPQLLDNVHVSLEACPVQRRPAVIILGVHVSSRLRTSAWLFSPAAAISSRSILFILSFVDGWSWQEGLLSTSSGSNVPL
jgi:hypothetical protein